MRVLLAVAMIMLSAGTAFAQQETGGATSPGEIKAERAAERAYEKSLGVVPDEDAADPWGAVRRTNAPKPAKALKRRTGTRSAD